MAPDSPAGSRQGKILKPIATITAALSITAGVAFGLATESVGVAIGTVAALWYLAFVIRAANPVNEAKDAAELDTE